MSTPSKAAHREELSAPANQCLVLPKAQGQEMEKRATIAGIRIVAMAPVAHLRAVLEPVKTLSPVLCPLGFVHGYRCAACSWAMLFPDCHVSWAVPFCYQLQAKSAFDEHVCGQPHEQDQRSDCRLCRDE